MPEERDWRMRAEAKTHKCVRATTKRCKTQNPPGSTPRSTTRVTSCANTALRATNSSWWQPSNRQNSRQQTSQWPVHRQDPHSSNPGWSNRTSCHEEQMQWSRGRTALVHLFGRGECMCTHGLAVDGHQHEASAGLWRSLLEQLKGGVVVERYVLTSLRSQIA